MVQGFFRIKRGKLYNNDGLINDTEVKKKINGFELPSSVTVDQVLGKIKDWANSVDNKGEFFWDDLIGEVIKTEFPSSSSSSSIDYETMFTPYTPDSSQSTPPHTPVWTFERRLSEDFSEKFKGAFGHTTEEVREEKTVLEHKETEARGTTYGSGRFMTMTGPKVLGETRYEDFLPKLPTLTGLTAQQVAKAIVDGLLDDTAFNITLETITTTNGAEALTKTVRLMHNEIIHRSSTNLLSIIGGAVRTIHDSSKTLAARYENEGKFVPQAKDYTKSKIGGQQLSRMHHTGSQQVTYDKAEAELQEIWRLNKKALHSVLAAHYASWDDLFTDISDKLVKKYMDNLSSGWTFTVGT